MIVAFFSTIIFGLQTSINATSALALCILKAVDSFITMVSTNKVCSCVGVYVCSNMIDLLKYNATICPLSNFEYMKVKFTMCNVCLPKNSLSPMGLLRLIWRSCVRWVYDLVLLD